jgi:hypothetical protein
MKKASHVHSASKLSRTPAKPRSIGANLAISRKMTNRVVKASPRPLTKSAK